MYTCSQCRKSYDNRYAFLGHCSSHARTVKPKARPNVSNRLHVCSFCQAIFDTGQKLGAHVVRCSQNPNAPAYLAARTAANKKRLAEESTKDRLSRSQKTSQTIQRKVKEGTWHCSFSKVRTHTYNGTKFHGMWEKQLAEWLDQHNVAWIRPTSGFSYVYGEKNRQYFPDFFLPDVAVYLEVKGYETPRDHAKWAAFPQTLVILRKDELRDLGVISQEQYIGKC